MEIQILVNGNRCKQYNHQGKTYIEAKNGSEYVIEVKNNAYQRILSVGAVDGLNVLTGKTASETDTGYIVDAYSSMKIKGFRYSNDEWAMFKFGYKFNGKTYAQSKEDGSEKNCGIISLRMFYEMPVPYTPPAWVTYSNNNEYCDGGINQVFFSDAGHTGGLLRSAPSPSDCAKKSGNHYTTNVNFLSHDSSQAQYCADMPKVTYSSTGAKGLLGASVKPQGFDMGTEWGRKETSKVHNVSFERGSLAQSFDIYYASRESLIEMGVPITNELKVTFPQGFPNGFAQPPKGWVG